VTLGISFWKKGSRKVYAVKNRKREQISIDSDDSTDSEGHRYKRHKNSDILKMDGKLTKLQDDLNCLKEEVSKVLSLTKDSRVPIALKNSVQESFSCLICKTAPMNTPVTASRCCGAIIGCSSCVDTWYSTGSNIFDQACPHCRGERAYSNTFRLTGLDEFLNKLRDICCEDNMQV
jgi:hypothetical protein